MVVQVVRCPRPGRGTFPYPRDLGTSATEARTDLLLETELVAGHQRLLLELQNLVEQAQVVDTADAIGT